MNTPVGKPKLVIIYNDEPKLEYDRNKALLDHQALYLEKMDEKMKDGITIGEDQINNPDENQRAQFVAANLAHAIQTDHEAMMASLCSYLAVRLENLQQVIITEKDGGMEIDFNFDKPYAPAVLVDMPTKAKPLN